MYNILFHGSDSRKFHDRAVLSEERLDQWRRQDHSSYLQSEKRYVFCIRKMQRNGERIIFLTHKSRCALRSENLKVIISEKENLQEAGWRFELEITRVVKNVCGWYSTRVVQLIPYMNVHTRTIK